MTLPVGRIVVLGLAVLSVATVVRAEDDRLVLNRGNGTIVLEPYGPNINRVTLSALKDKATAGPGYGFSGTPVATGWSHRQDEQGTSDTESAAITSSSGWAATASISSPTVTPGQTIVIHGVITSPTSLNGVGIAYSLHDIARKSMGQIGFGNENHLVAGQAWPQDWYVTVPTNITPGTYYLGVGIYDSTWKITHHFFDKVVTLNVIAGSGPSLLIAPAARKYFGQKLEPVGNFVIDGVGQGDKASYTSYAAALRQSPPVVFMTYVELNRNVVSWGTTLLSTLNSFSLASAPVIPQIGLTMTVDGSPSKHYENQVAAGAYDQQIEQFCQALYNLNRPAYVRIGYEFNGDWNGYAAKDYVAAFKRVANAIRAHGLEAAIIWDVSPEGAPNYLAYYPGDDYVDWWGINLFPVGIFNGTVTGQFLRDAIAHGKPIMIGESAPDHVGVLKGQASWETWYVPFFDFIRGNANVKQFDYINWNWAAYPHLGVEGDGVLSDNPVVQEHYQNEMLNPLYLHRQSNAVLRSVLRLPPESTVPPFVPAKLPYPSIY